MSSFDTHEQKAINCHHSKFAPFCSSHFLQCKSVRVLTDNKAGSVEVRTMGLRGFAELRPCSCKSREGSLECMKTARQEFAWVEQYSNELGVTRPTWFDHLSFLSFLSLPKKDKKCVRKTEINSWGGTAHTARRWVQLQLVNSRTLSSVERGKRTQNPHQFNTMRGWKRHAKQRAVPWRVCHGDWSRRCCCCRADCRTSRCPGEARRRRRCWCCRRRRVPGTESSSHRLLHHCCCCRHPRRGSVPTPLRLPYWEARFSRKVSLAPARCASLAFPRPTTFPAGMNK